MAIIEDDPVIREFLGVAVRTAEGFSAPTMHASGAEAVALLASRPADVALVDFHLPGESGAAVIEHLLSSQACRAVIVLTADGSDETIRQAILAGADGYLLKEESLERVVSVLQETQQGKPAVGTCALDFLIRQLGPPQDGPSIDGLSRRENEVLALMASGMGTRQIADRLGVNFRTVYKHNRQVLRKLGVKRRLDAIKVYQQRVAAAVPV